MLRYEDKPWLQSYDPGVPASLKPYPNHSVHAFLEQTAQRVPQNIAMIASARLPVLGRPANRMDYQTLNAHADALAAAFVDMGLQKGDKVALVMPNCMQFVISFFAVLKAGGVVAATNPTYPKDKMQHQINDCGAKFVVTLSLFYNSILEIQPQTQLQQVIVTNIKEYLPTPARLLFTLAKEKKDGHAIDKRPQDHSLQDLLKRYAGQKAQVEVTAQDIALFQYTGGTTGVSKAAMASHAAMVANIIMCKTWLGAENPAEDSALAAIPLFHVYGLVGVMGFAVASGATMILVPNARDIEDVLDNIHSFRPSLFMGVPALYNAINHHPKVLDKSYDLSSIRACMSGSAPLPPSTKATFEQISGGIVVEGFGMSEAPTATHINPLRGENRVGSIGLPLPDVEVRIVSLDDPDQDVPIGEVGELIIHGPQLMSGYYNMPSETENTLRADASGKQWLYTGDIARMDEQGYCYIVDRKKDMALIGGFNVYPRAIEDVLMGHPAVLEVGVAAVPHPSKPGQEALKAWVVKKEGEQVTDQELISFCQQKLAQYEVPSRYQFVDSLPRTTVGKVLRRELARMEMEAREQG